MFSATFCRFLALLAALFYVEVAKAQWNSNMKVKLTGSPTPEISIAPLTRENTPDIDAAKLADVHPSAFVLTNLSNRAIVALAVEWVYTNVGGHTANGFHKSDGFFIQNSPALVQPHARLFVGPQVFLPESLAFTPHVGAGFEALDGNRSSWSINAFEITASLDMVIFDDGELVGPNRSEYDAEITARKLAAEQVVSKVRYAQSKGEDPTRVLRSLAGERIVGQKDFVAQWSTFYAQRLMKAPRLDAQLASLENIPIPPKFFRK